MKPLMEIRWLWRRLCTFAVAGLAIALLAVVIFRTRDPDALKWIGLGLIALIALAHTVYLTGATVTDWARLAAAARPALPLTGEEKAS